MLVTIADVVDAVEGEQMVPSFQPIVDLRTGTLKGFEVLARWNHPEHGSILPLNFISLAEQCGLIGMMTDQVFRAAFAAAKSLPASLELSLNVSPLQMHYTTLPRQLRESAELCGFPMDR
jgi:EAL domain-containing protein (putative c-di-GMP-specific phosphodiesterase class I)